MHSMVLWELALLYCVRWEQDCSWSRPLWGYARGQCSNLRYTKRKTFECGNVKGGVGQRLIHISSNVFSPVGARGRLAGMGLLQQSRGLLRRLIISGSRVGATTNAVLAGLELCNYCIIFSGEHLGGRFSRAAHVLVFGRSPRRCHPTGYPIFRQFITRYSQTGLIELFSIFLAVRAH